jgi:carboxypeptidase PM20D1
MGRIVKRALLAILLLLVVLTTIVVWRGARLESKQLAVSPAPPEQINLTAAVERLTTGLRFETVSHQSDLGHEPAPFADLHASLYALYPNTHRTLSRELLDGGVLYTWNGSEPSLPPILLLGHLDVVPVEVAQGWTHPPFDGVVDKDYIWGRGAIDDKSAVFGILEAVEHLTAKGHRPQRTIYLAFGHDEEVGGQRGAAKMAALLEQRGVKALFALDEGMSVTHGLTPGATSPVALIGIAEKGYVTLELTVEGKGGHSSMPPPRTAVGVLARAVTALEDEQMEATLAGPLEQLFEYVGPELSFLKRVVFANQWLFGPIVRSTIESGGTTGNALLRTTTAATMVEGSPKENVLPARATARVNFRIHPSNSIEDVVQHAKSAIDNDSVVVAVAPGATEPSRVSKVRSRGYSMLERSIREVFSEAIVAPGLVIGMTDSRHYAAIADDIYRFAPLRLAADDLPRIHGKDERLAITNYGEMIQFYIRLIRNTDKH